MYKSNGNITYDCKYHIIFCPKYRKPVLVDEVEKMLKEILPYKADELGAEIIEMETDKDHVHLLISCDPQFGIHKVVKGLKGFSSRILRENFPHLKSSMPSMWTNSYFVETIGSVSLEVAKQYIENQQVRTKK
ncbi:IS200/IS605 family transposase [Clostridioides difficile]